ncbi:AmiS/UreI family transporter [Arthrobacter globiformis]|uniref:AmiS/UreI transporter n=1 Tax=Arthrobacter globiformis TaxID=1665 RepID=A0A328HIC3_ARTGO|nr:AmiS/UreI family transporter [Arthrobacter globiformis]RAM37914.1 AmiS/UreI transporter [Arthrobacter globiformis]
MTYVCLLLSGAALLINGLAALDRVPRRDAAVFSLVIGNAQLILGVAHLAVTAGGGTQSLLGAAGMFLFGLTYVYVGLDFLLGLGSKGLGWFCGMVAVCGILLAAAWSGEDPLLAVLWLCWTYLWLLFFLNMALGFQRMAPLIGWSLVLTSQASATVPAFLGITGQWPAAIAAAAAAGASLAALLLLAGGLARRVRRSGTGAAAVGRPLPGELRR